jgi:cytochrome c biogenesis protein CcmG, thiol:disulfide interchange protein DsbE
MKLKFALPLLGFVALCVFLFVGLSLNPREIPSALIGKPAPGFEIPVLGSPAKTLTPKEWHGKVWVLNVWASWCVSCRDEHPLFVDLAKQGALKHFVGLNYKDKDAAAMKWLTDLGDPYSVSIVDADGRVGIEYGVYGVPETFVIDKAGIVRYKHIGPVTRKAWTEKIAPKIAELEQVAS